MKDGDFVKFKYGSGTLYKFACFIEPETWKEAYYVIPLDRNDVLVSIGLIELEPATEEDIAAYVTKKLLNEV